jgi:hypothetical protein
LLVVRTAMLRQLRLLLACLLLAVAARPAVTALELQRPVAAFLASADARPSRSVVARAAARAESRTRSRLVRSLTTSATPAALVAHQLTTPERTPFRAKSPLYLTYERLLL